MSSGGFVKISILAVIVLAASLSFAQAPAPLASFEVASVRVVPGGGLPDSFTLKPRRSAGRFTWTTTPDSLVQYAFHAPAWRISGMGKGMIFVRIEANTDASASEDQVRLMLQALLADRFKLSFHREIKELQGYALQAAKSGPKLQTKTAQGTSPPMPSYLSGKPIEAFEGQIFDSMEGVGSSAITGRGVPMSALAETISEAIGAFVLEQTGLTGNYYFGFRFTRPNDLTVGVDTVPIFSALPDELGLRLEKQKGPVEVIVVDHFEPPSEN
jgi:uncharacterized protein (TIGR03435 family)